ncbi:MAG TPA: hypothetical protein VGC92_13120 [Phenylobacterium sp.]|jgi:hypothetical protein
MRPIPILILTASLGLTGCAAARATVLPVCDGHHRRPANPNGSVLEPAEVKPPVAAAPTPATPPSAAAPECSA